MKVRGILPQLNSYSLFKDPQTGEPSCRVGEATCVGSACQETFLTACLFILAQFSPPSSRVFLDLGGGVYTWDVMRQPIFCVKLEDS